MSKGSIVLTFVIDQEDGMYLSRCVELDTHSCGKTEGEALDNIEEATAVHLSMLEELGERARV